MPKHIFVAIPLMAVLAVLHTSVLAQIPVLGAAPQLLFLVALAWGIVRGMEEGLAWAFVAGMFTDLFSLAPLGISALAFMAGVAGPLMIRRALPTHRLLVAMFLAALGTVIYLTVYAVGLRIFGFGIGLGGLAELLPLIGFHAILILPIYLIVDSILRTFRPRRVEF